MLTVIEQFQAQVAKTPDSLAIVFEETRLSFKQLDDLASKFAACLLSVGVEEGDTVGLCIDRCPEAIAAMLGAFKINAVYVPLDPEYPLDRVRYMIDDAAIKVIITHDKEQNPLAKLLCTSDDSHNEAAPSFQWIDSASQTFLQTIPSMELRLPSPDDLAYIMYTSGSTGMPKGVQIEHGALRTYCDADREVYELTHNDRTLQFSTLNFDIAIEEIFPPLLVGGCVVIRPRQRAESNNELSWIIDRYQVTAIHIATAYWHEWVDLMVASQATVPACLRLVIATGEKVSVEHYRRWKSICKHDVKWCNAYGPTETTVTCTVFIPGEDFCDEHMPIGKPLPGYQAYILDEANRPLGTGETGQLFIGGKALARGYHRQPAKTSAAFLDVELPELGKTRIYRTGDLARWLPSGDIEFAGRVDHQIKVGSYRIEPGEIEVAIARFPGILESIVVHEQIATQKFLIAYLATGGQPIDLTALQAHLQTTLPAYMVPRRYVLLASLPKTINGKIDRRSLPAPETSISAGELSTSDDATETERKLIEIWKSVLHYPAIGVEDNFFFLGGSSLLVTRVVAAVATQFQIELPVRDFFANPTIATSALHIDHLIAQRLGNAGAKKSEAYIPRARSNRLPKLHASMIASGQGSIFSVRYEPQTSRRNHGVLICNSVGHEHARAYRNLQQLALGLCECGFDVLRFDYQGTGNSSGSCDSVTTNSMQADTRAAASSLREQTGIDPLSIIGIRLGATIAATAKVKDLERLILWDPVIDGKHFNDQLDRFHHEALQSQTRFTRRMKREGCDQAYGHAMGMKKRDSLDGLRLPQDYADGCRQADVLVSSEYLAKQPAFSWHRDSCVTELTDHIEWHDVAFTESAFASPAAFNEIKRILTQPLTANHPRPSMPMPALNLTTTGLEVHA